VNVLPSVNEPGEEGNGEEYMGDEFAPRAGEVYLDYDAAYAEDGNSNGSHRSPGGGNGKGRPNSGVKTFTSRMFTW
jgi:hypothetical protein